MPLQQPNCLNKLFFDEFFPMDINNQVTKSHPKGGEDIKFSIDWSDKWLEAIKMKLPNWMPSQVNVRIVEIE